MPGWRWQTWKRAVALNPGYAGRGTARRYARARFTRGGDGRRASADDLQHPCFQLPSLGSRSAAVMSSKPVNGGCQQPSRTGLIVTGSRDTPATGRHNVAYSTCGGTANSGQAGPADEAPQCAGGKTGAGGQRVLQPPSADAPEQWGVLRREQPDPPQAATDQRCRPAE